MIAHSTAFIPLSHQCRIKEIFGDSFYLFIYLFVCSSVTLLPVPSALAVCPLFGK
jgi:hypothetical protein